MLWKKILLELATVSGFGGGIGGGFGFNGQGVSIDSEEETSYLKGEESLRINKGVRSSLSDGGGQISELDHTILGSGRWQSEGVGEDLLFVKGGSGAGPHKRISSENHSQAWRDLWGGKGISLGNNGFGPRRVSRSIDDMEVAKKARLQKGEIDSYWPIIQKSAHYLNQEDLDGIQKFGQNRDRELEEDIFGLYHGGKGWADKFGTRSKNGQDRVDLEFDLSKLKQVLELSEENLRDKDGNYGELFKNPKLSAVRLLGNVEATVFNYGKHVAGPNSDKVKKLKEKKIAIAVLALMLGEEIGFDCKSGDAKHKTNFFDECNPSIKEGKVKRVLKSTGQHNGEFGVPIKGLGAKGHQHRPLRDSKDKQQLIKMDDVPKTSLLDEKCEDPSNFLTYFMDSSKDIRREVCDLILRPGFGDLVQDKRLCLIELKDFNYHFRLNTYLQVLEIPAGNKRNTFGTKCSNYGI